MSKADFANERPPAYEGTPAYPMQCAPLYTPTPPPQSYPTQAPAPSYPTQGVVSPHQVIIQPNAGRQVIVTGAQPVSSNQTVVIQSQPAYTALNAAKHNPFPVTGVCTNCQQTVTTRVEYTVGNYTWVVAGVMSLLGLCLCAFIPCCMDSCKDAQHYCPACNKYYGVHQRLQC